MDKLELWFFSKPFTIAIVIKEKGVYSDLQITEDNRLIPEHFMLVTIYAFKSLNSKASRKAIDNKIAELYRISDEEREIKIKSLTSEQTRFKGICSSARTYLLSGGALRKRRCRQKYSLGNY